MNFQLKPELSLASWAAVVALLCIPLAIGAGGVVSLGALILMLFGLIAADTWTTESRNHGITADSTVRSKKSP